MKAVYTLDDLRHWPAATASEPVPLRIAVLGDPVAHSRSPQMHNAALEECHLPARYCRLHIRPQELREALALLPAAGFLGVNLTIPHKVAALDLMHELSDDARAMGAMNTVRISPEGRLSGFNTDGPGLVRAVGAEFGAALSQLRVLIVGAGGGAGQAIAVQCALEKCPRLVLVNRTAEKAQALATRLGAEALPWTPEALAPALRDIDLVINATSLGMNPEDEPVIPTALMHPGLFVYDTIYTAHRTPLVTAALQAGARAANGLSMLLYQGVQAFEIWFHTEAPVAKMREGLLSTSAEG